MIFEVKVKYEKNDENGKTKKVNEVYLFEAVNNGDAEERAHKELESYVSGEFSVKATKETNYNEIIFSDEFDDWYKCKVTFIYMDEESGREKKTSVNILIQGDNVAQAYFAMCETLKDTVSDYTIPKVELSNIVEVFSLSE